MTMYEISTNGPVCTELDEKGYKTFFTTNLYLSPVKISTQ